MKCRDIKRGKAAKEHILKSNPRADLKVTKLDLTSLVGIDKFIGKLDDPINVLICNAGIALSNKPRQLKSKIDITFFTNHLGHYALTIGLLNKFKKNLSNVLVVSSDAHNPDKNSKFFPKPRLSSIEEIAYPDNKSVSDWKKEGRLRYVHSKLCNVLFAYELDRKISKSKKYDAKVNAYHPGFVPDTNLSRDSSSIMKFLLKYIIPNLKFIIPQIRRSTTAAKYMVDIVDKNTSSGKYYDGPVETKSSEQSYDQDLAEELWTLSRKITDKDLK